MFIGHLYIFFGKISIQILCPFWNCIFLLLSYKFLYIFWIQIPYQMYANIFSCSVNCLFHFLHDVIWNPKVFNFAEVQFICSFFSFCFSVISKKVLSYPSSWRLLLDFLLRNWDLWSILSPFCISVMKWSSFIILQVDIQLSQHHLPKKKLFFHNWIVLVPLSKIN